MPIPPCSYYSALGCSKKDIKVSKIGYKDWAED
jgi:hypothetical protein